MGPGVGTDEDAAAVLQAVLASDVPVLVDADALTVLARHPDWVRNRFAPTLLTPHLGEFARLTGVDVEASDFDRLGAARDAASDLGATVLLKGSGTVVADPDWTARINPTGTSRLATAGSGDVLSGAGGSLLATGLSPLDAGPVAAFLHGLAARLAPGPVAAADLVEHWPAATPPVMPASCLLPRRRRGRRPARARPGPPRPPGRAPSAPSPRQQAGCRHDRRCGGREPPRAASGGPDRPGRGPGERNRAGRARRWRHRDGRGHSRRP